MSWTAETLQEAFKITKEEAEIQVRQRAMDRLRHVLGAALRTARQEGLSGEDAEEAWRLAAVAEVQDELSSPKVPFIPL